MPTYQQADCWMTVTTPLGPDDLLLVGFDGTEAISQLFSFQLDLVAENQTTILSGRCGVAWADARAAPGPGATPDRASDHAGRAAPGFRSMLTWNRGLPAGRFRWRISERLCVVSMISSPAGVKVRSL